MSIEELLRKRKELDEILHKEYSRSIAVMFTDIIGSAFFFERRGDIEGRSMIQEHNDILFPLITNHKGTIVKTIGDSIMAYFNTPEDGVRSAIAIQRALFKRNRNKKDEDRIRVRIGLNYGRGIVQEHDVFGDVVNVASKVESLAGAEDILISEPIYRQIRRTEDILCRYFNSLNLKWKNETVDIYRVVWRRDEDRVVSKTRSLKAAVSSAAQTQRVRNILYLEILREDDNKVRVSCCEKAEGEEQRTLTCYENVRFPPTEIENNCRRIRNLLNQANRKGKISKDILVKLQNAGQFFYDSLLTSRVKEHINSTDAEYLILEINDKLVQIPWELFYDGQQFLCQRFSMGRLVKTSQSVAGIKTRQVEVPVKMLIIADPQRNLRSSYQEGLRILNEASKYDDLVVANFESGENINVDKVKKSFCHYDMVHFAGHASYSLDDPSRSGWLFSDGKFTAGEIRSLTETSLMPALVFSNACHSGQTEEWRVDKNFENKIYGLANGFLLSGVQHYLGTFWEIQDEPGSLFALEFYKQLFQGNTVGDAVRLAREALIKKYGEETVVWAGYMLYGNPAQQYFKEVYPRKEKKKKKKSGNKSSEAKEVLETKEAKEIEIKEVSFKCPNCGFAMKIVGEKEKTKPEKEDSDEPGGEVPESGLGVGV